MNIFVMICYDVADKHRLRQVANILENYGVRVQKSVFECHIKESDLIVLKQTMLNLLNPDEDNLRYYYLCPKDESKILLDGRADLTKNYDYQIF